MPKAQVVADRFHVMAQINKELDIQRKREKSQAEDLIKTAKTPEEKAEHEQVLAGLKKSKYALLKNEKDLSEEQESKLVQVKAVSPELKIMHKLKEEIRKIFEQSENWLTGLLKLGIWLASAKKYFPSSQKTIIRWLDEIIGYFDNRTTSGVVEGINNKLKLIKRSAYGFRNFENYRIRCLLNWHLSR
jgi:transposase